MAVKCPLEAGSSWKRWGFTSMGCFKASSEYDGAWLVGGVGFRSEKDVIDASSSLMSPRK